MAEPLNYAREPHRRSWRWRILFLLLAVGGAAAWAYRAPLKEFKNERMAVIERARYQRKELAKLPPPGARVLTWDKLDRATWPNVGDEHWPGMADDHVGSIRVVDPSGKSWAVSIWDAVRPHQLVLHAEPVHGYFDAPIPMTSPPYCFGPAPPRLPSMVLAILLDPTSGSAEVLSPEHVADQPGTIRFRFRQKDFETHVDVELTPNAFKVTDVTGIVLMNGSLASVAMNSPDRQFTDAAPLTSAVPDWPIVSADGQKSPDAQGIVMDGKSLLIFDGKQTHLRPREGGIWEQRAGMDPRVNRHPRLDRIPTTGLSLQQVVRSSSPDERWELVHNRSVYLRLHDRSGQFPDAELRMPSEPAAGDLHLRWSPDSRWLLLTGSQCSRYSFLVDPTDPHFFWVIPSQTVRMSDLVVAFSNDSKYLLLSHGGWIDQIDLDVMRHARSTSQHTR